MATLQDNVNTILTAVYGKEMRPAIAEALTQSWDGVKQMMSSVDSLNSRVDALSGGSTDPDTPGEGSDCNFAGFAVLEIDASITPLASAGTATLINF